jgi:hypothetical protein
LVNVRIPASVTTICHYAFMGCTSLTCIRIPESVTWLGDCVFNGCTELPNLVIPSSVTNIPRYAITGIGHYAFGGCTGLMKISIPSTILCSQLERDTHLGRLGFKTRQVMTYKTWKDVAKYMRIPRSVKEDVLNLILTLQRGSSLPQEMILSIISQCTTDYTLLSK